MLGGKVEDPPELSDKDEAFGLGGVLPRLPAQLADSGISCPRMDIFVSEEDRSSLAGDLLNSRRNEAPMLEARLGQVSSLLESIKLDLGLGSRTIPENGTADNLSMSPIDLLATWEQGSSR